ncbi:hypothetical protein OG900_38565 [Streptomyces sp. NBC_00433]
MALLPAGLDARVTAARVCWVWLVVCARLRPACPAASVASVSAGRFCKAASDVMNLLNFFFKGLPF